MSVIDPPSHWKEEPPPTTLPEFMRGASRYWKHKIAPLVVLRSKSTTYGGKQWWHLSVSRPDRLPSWQEIVKVRDEFLGSGVEAYQVLPAEKDYVNLHNYCLHLWTPVDGRMCVANLQDIVLEVRA